MTAISNQLENFETCSRLSREAREKGASMVFFPEASGVTIGPGLFAALSLEYCITYSNSRSSKILVIDTPVPPQFISTM